MGTIRYKQIMAREKNGVPVCSCGCDRPIQPGSKHWATDACHDEWRIQNDVNYIRQKVYARDKGICAKCGVDANKAFAEWKRNKAQAWHFTEWLLHMAHEDKLDRFYNGQVNLKLVQQERKRLMQRWSPPGAWIEFRLTGWDADHIISIYEGGKPLGLGNIQTLCHPCHKEKTKDLVFRMKKRRYEKNKMYRQQLLAIDENRKAANGTHV